MSATLLQPPYGVPLIWTEKHAAETDTFAVDLTAVLVGGDAVSGTPTVTVSPAGPTVSSIQVAANAAGTPAQVVLFKLAGGTGTQYYVVTVTFSTVNGRGPLVEQQALLVLP